MSPTTSRLPAGRAALAGLLAVAVALAAGHLTAGLLLELPASPFLAVGNAAIDRTPTPVKELAVAWFGTNDKLALLVGMAVVIGLLGLLAGLVSRSRVLPGLLAIAVLGVVGVVAVLEQASAWPGLVAPAVSLLTGLGAFAGLHRPLRRPPAAAAPEGSPLRRRGILLGSLGIAAGSAAAALAGQALAGRNDIARARQALGALVPAVPAPPIPEPAAFPELGTPTFITPNRDFYRIDINLTPPRVPAEGAVLRITGMVDRPVTLTYEQIRSRRLVEQTMTLVCVSNPVGGNLVSTSNFLGVPLAELLAEAGVRPDATQLIGRSVDDFTIGTPLRQVLDPQPGALLPMLVVGMNREPLPIEHGFPMRTVVPGLYGYVSATKWLSELELTTFETDPYWEQRGWDGDPGGIVPIKTSSRIDAPTGRVPVVAGEVSVAGTAWAPGRGIQRVEVRFDGGPWREAELAATVNDYTWRMWRLGQVLPPGPHTATVRATDGTGELQTAEEAEAINPGPDGTTGWHTVRFTVA